MFKFIFKIQRILFPAHMLFDLKLRVLKALHEQMGTLYADNTKAINGLEAVRRKTIESIREKEEHGGLIDDIATSLGDIVYPEA